MNNHSNLSDSDFLLQFSNCTLAPALFTHEAHLRLAWLHIKLYGVIQAEENIQTELRSFVNHVGAQNKYHVTLTVAAVKIVGHFMAKSNTNNFQEFINENPQLNTNFKELIKNHYSIDIFNSEVAKSEFLEPDLLPF